MDYCLQQYKLQIAATRIHESLLSLLPLEAKEEHETWFKAKNISNNEVISETTVLFAMCSENGNVCQLFHLQRLMLV